MVNIFNSHVLNEVGEAIGDVGNKVFNPRRARAELVDEIFRRRLGTARQFYLPQSDDFIEGNDEFIDVSYRILSPDDGEVDP